MMRDRSGRRRSRMSTAAVASITIVVLMLVSHAATAGAPVLIDDVLIKGPGPTRWDAENGGNSCNTSDIYTPVSDGEFDTQDDAFDDGLALNVEGIDFLDSDENGTRVRKMLTVGPEPIAGVRVWRTDQVLTTSPTMRSLIRFKNPTAAPIRLDVLWDSNLGSDGSELVQATANGDTTYGLNDRWVVSSDDAATPSDPVLTFVLFGKRAAVRPNTIVDTFGSGCFGVELRLRVKARSSGFLLFFTQMNGTNESGISGAAQFNRVRPGSDLLRGLAPRVLRNIRNWDLA